MAARKRPGRPRDFLGGLPEQGYVPRGGGYSSKIRQRGDFETQRGSRYKHYDDATTVRYRSGKDHPDKSTGRQPRSGKTIFMNKKDVHKTSGWFQNKDVDVSFVPIGKNKAQVILNKPYGPKKEGSIVETISFSTSPRMKNHPVEIYSSRSPLGDSGKGIHFGSEIIKISKKGGGSIERNPHDYQPRAI
jgi:hypothetical protein